MGYIFNVGDLVEVMANDSFDGLQGVVTDVIVGGDSNTMYGVNLYESRLIYFLAKELKEVK